jgi:hypothetical protein
MQIVRKTSHVIVTGPRVAVTLFDIGKAQVSITLALSDGTLFSYTGGATRPSETLLPPGNYECAAVISAFNHGAFGDQYDSTVNVGGQTVATAQGSVQVGQHDSGAVSFALTVQ